MIINRRLAAVLAFFLAAGLGAGAFLYCQKLQGDRPVEDSRREIHVSRHSRLLVVAPHCDDEVLGAGGLIQKVIQEKGKVKIVVLTNGDGFVRAAKKNGLYTEAESSGFIRLGYLRKNESLSALRAIGIAACNVLFLGYPDRGLAYLWTKNWPTTNPYTSPRTKADFSPYEFSYRPHVLYAGENLTRDLKEIILEFKPTIVAYPHSIDEHPDHAAAYAFVKLVLFQLNTIRPQELLYVVHHHGWPAPSGKHPEKPLAPPHPRPEDRTLWQTLTLSPSMAKKKLELIGKYRSQIAVVGDLLYSFARKNEIFGSERDLVLAFPAKKPAEIISAGGKSPVHSWQISSVAANFDRKVFRIRLRTAGAFKPDLSCRMDLTFFSADGSFERIGLIAGKERTVILPFSRPSVLAGHMTVRRCADGLRIEEEASRLNKTRGLMIKAGIFRGRRELDRTEWRTVLLVRKTGWGNISVLDGLFRRTP